MTRPTLYYCKGTVNMLPNVPVPLAAQVTDLTGPPLFDMFHNFFALNPDLTPTTVSQYYNVIDVPYPAVWFPASYSWQTGVSMLTDLINQTPGPFALAGLSQGAYVCSKVYQQILSGTLQSRSQDFLGGFMYGNPARQAGHTLPIPGAIDPGGHGVASTGERLTNSEGRWWEFANPADPVAVEGDDEVGLTATDVFDFIWLNWNGLYETITVQALDFLPDLNPATVLQELEELISALIGGLPAHIGYRSYQPITGDSRGSIQVAFDQLIALAKGGTSVPPPRKQTGGQAPPPIPPAVDTTAQPPPTTPVPGPGDIVYLCSCLIQMSVSALQTPPDTPNQYTATPKVMGDAGDMTLDAIRGHRGPDGQPQLQLRDAVEQMGRDPVNDPGNLPTLTDSSNDIGIYWLIDDLDADGHVLGTWAYVWWGSYYRQIMMGTIGPPGAVPEIDLLMTLVDPSLEGYIHPSGGILAPTWQFMLPSPRGPVGPAGPLWGFPDVDMSAAPAPENVLAFTGDYVRPGGAAAGEPLWHPYDLQQWLPKTYSMPSSAFTPYVGVSQQAPIGSYEIPAPPYPWTPIVWGHLSAGGLDLGGDPLTIGCQVLVNDQTTGQQIARGIGNPMGEINISPHYSSSKNTNAAITPKNHLALIPANTGASIYVNLWNDGQLGVYNFYPNATTSPLQSGLDSLTSAIGGPAPTIGGVVSLLSSFTGGIFPTLQGVLNAVASLLGIPGDSTGNATIDGVTQGLNTFGSVADALSSALGLSGTNNPLTSIMSALGSWTSAITSELQNAMDSVASIFGLAGLGATPGQIHSQLNTLQPSLQTLSDLLGGNSISAVTSLLSSFAGTITTPIQTALDLVGGMLGGSSSGNTVSGVNSLLTEFDSLLNNLGSGLGLGSTGNTLTGVVSGLAPWITGAVTTGIQTPMDALSSFLGGTGLGQTVSGLLGLLQPLLGALASAYTTDAQLFIMVQPMLAENT